MKNNRIICDTIFVRVPPSCLGGFLRVYSDRTEKVFTLSEALDIAS